MAVFTMYPAPLVPSSILATFIQRGKARIRTVIDGLEGRLLMRRFVLLPLLLWGFYAAAQAPAEFDYTTTRFDWPKQGEVTVRDVSIDWAPKLQRIEAPAPGSTSYRSFLARLKEQYKQDRPAGGTYSAKQSSSTPTPVQFQGFEGNSYGGGVPNDNDMAISNSGIIVSVINSNIYMFDSKDGTELKNISLSAFSLTLGLPEHDFDPKVEYDPDLDRFVLVFLNGSTSSENMIVVAFSQTPDPTGQWNLYAIDGNPFNSGVWSDYPIIALNENELFVTVNFIIDDSSWQGGFTQSVIWQIDKFDGYNGNSTLSTQLHSGIKFGPSFIRNLCAVKGGSQLYGPNMYFLSNKNFSATDDRIYILEITDTIGAPGQQFKAVEKRTSTDYGLSPEARQKVPHVFDTNDSRILGAFIENNSVQFVNNTIVPSTGFAGVYHGVISDIAVAKSVSGHIIGDPVLDLGYPNLSYSGLSEKDNQSIITFNHVSPDTFAGYSSVFYRNDGSYSPRKHLKEGGNVVNVLTQINERWGDYTGSQRKYDEPGVVWASGSYAKMFGSTFATSTWITGLHTPDSVPPVDFVPEFNFIKAYPNPAWDMVNVELDIVEDAPELDFYLYDMSGKQVVHFLRQGASAGRHQFWFNAAHLNAGLYFVRAMNGNKVLATKKIVVVEDR
jgi:hypothetical protein